MNDGERRARPRQGGLFGPVDLPEERDDEATDRPKVAAAPADEAAAPEAEGGEE